MNVDTQTMVPMHTAFRRFLVEWSAQGKHGRPDMMSVLQDAEIAARLLTLNLVDGFWRYGTVGALHHERNGVKIEGDFATVQHAAGSFDVGERILDYARIVGSGEPGFLSGAGTVGASRDLTSNRVFAPVQPAPGAQATLLGVFDWTPGAPKSDIAAPEPADAAPPDSAALAAMSCAVGELRRDYALMRCRTAIAQPRLEKALEDAVRELLAVRRRDFAAAADDAIGAMASVIADRAILAKTDRERIDALRALQRCSHSVADLQKAVREFTDGRR